MHGLGNTGTEYHDREQLCEARRLRVCIDNELIVITVVDINENPLIESKN